MKKGLFVLLLLSMIFIAGCTSLLGNRGGNIAGKGVSASFLPNRPPTDEIVEGQEFQVVVELFNNGLNVANGEVCVSDTLSALFGGIETARDCQTFSLAGGEASQEEFINRQERFYFPAVGNAYSYRTVNSDITTKVKAEVSYSYITIASPQICISSSERDCRLDEVISGAALGQDALRSPVTVTKVEKSLTPGVSNAGVSLKVYIQNTGGGKVVDNSGDDRERVDININLLGGSVEFRCTPTGAGVITLEKGSKVITCNANVPLQEGAEENPLQIELRYNYLATISTGDIRIKNTV